MQIFDNFDDDFVEVVFARFSLCFFPVDGFGYFKRDHFVGLSNVGRARIFARYTNHCPIIIVTLVK